MFIKLAYKSLANRKASVVLTILAMTVSICVLLGIEHIRHQSKESFKSTVSGVDLIVGARTGSLNLLLYSVFRIGSPTNNISWDNYNRIAASSSVKWAFPISLGDSHKGYRVMGTTEDYFKHFSYGNKRKLEFNDGAAFKDVLDVVLGYDVAKKLKYNLGDSLVLSHGISKVSFSVHDDNPFKVVGILAPTGTPVDQTLHVSLQGIEAIHVGWKNGVKMPSFGRPQLQVDTSKLEPKSITAFMLGLKSKMTVFKIQREINNYRKEPLSSILPGVALSELWQMMGVLEDTLRLISILILISALLGLSAMLLTSIRERQNEVQLLRIIGASPLFLFFLIELEAVLISLCSIVLGILVLSFGLYFLHDYLAANFGLYVSANIFSKNSLILIVVIILLTILAAAIPSFNAYKNAKFNLK